jgi:Uma2 family endonuclease
MAATAIQEKIRATVMTVEKPKRITWLEFEKKYLIREDSFKYEWVNGLIEKTPRNMDQKQQFIYSNLSDFLTNLRFAGKANGRLLAEVDTFFIGDTHRRPDIAYFSDEQLKSMAQDMNQVPKFVVEIISTKDQINLVHKKMRDYRDAEVEVIWHIFPLLNEIHIYNGLTMNICTGEMMCSAESVIPHFKLSVNQIFKKN